jgi:predicted enzyme related to lactoylglutathione lyase
MGGKVIIHQIVHFEIPADDVKRAQTFYKKLFGWQFSSPPGFDDYWGVDLGEDASHGIGMMARQNPSHGPTSYIGVESVADTLTQVEQLGGNVLVPKSPVPGMGWFATCQDTEGNVFALWEEDTSAA